MITEAHLRLRRRQKVRSAHVRIRYTRHAAQAPYCALSEGVHRGSVTIGRWVVCPHSARQNTSPHRIERSRSIYVQIDRLDHLDPNLPS